MVDRSRCTGIGICESVQPLRYEVGDDGTLAVLDDVVPEEDRATAEEAIFGCPASALSLIREGD
ncbi:ferredoxin [Dactylosporangium sp. NPDC005572]|uniref:ferredoxin n=1 Tax=Dactylosporangium sp. NPDC005572 TaxID=3156889 RepID=UPI0033AB03A6